MAVSDVQGDQITQEEEKSLKYLGFVHVAAIQALLCFSKLYEYAKENSGPLKSGVQSVEGTVKTVVGPVYNKFYDVPFEFLKFVDRKVDESVCDLGKRMPPLVKDASTQAYTVVQKAPEVARSVAGEVQRTGVVGTATGIAKSAYVKCEPAAKDLYSKYEPAAERCAVSAWKSLNRLPLFPQVAHVMVPTAAYWSEKYNQAVCHAADHGYVVSAYLPLVPTQRIAKVFSEDNTGAEAPAVSQ